MPRLLFLLLIPFLAFCKTKTSVIIPCHASHAIRLEGLLNSYARQSLVPTEIVISVSSADETTASIIDKLKERPYPFQLQIVSSPDRQSAGQNRNIACSLSKGDLIICQDADDFPHPQRVEIITYLFETVGFDHLLHSYVLCTDQRRNDVALAQFNAKRLIPSAVKYRTITRDPEREALQFGNKFHITNGNPAFRRAVFNRVQWKDQFSIGEDVNFNARVRLIFKKTLLTNAPLYFYCNWASSFNEENTR